jgi:pyrimidine-nucleoside phosphorylase
MLVLAGKCQDTDEARRLLETCIRDGSALAKFKEFIAGQGGNADWVDHPEKLPQPAQEIPLLAEENGFVQAIHAEEVGLAAMRLGAGRATKEDVIDHAVGIVLHKKTGDTVKKGEAIATLLVNRTEPLAEVEKRLRQAIEIGKERVTPPPLIRCIVTAEGVFRV